MAAKQSSASAQAAKIVDDDRDADARHCPFNLSNIVNGPKFTGTTTGLSLQHFKRYVAALELQAGPQANAVLFTVLPLALNGGALEWFETLDRSSFSVAGFLKALDARYGRSEYHRKLDRLQRLRTLPEPTTAASLVKFVEEFTTATIDVPEATRRDMFVAFLPVSIRVQVAMAITDDITLETAVERARLLGESCFPQAQPTPTQARLPLWTPPVSGQRRPPTPCRFCRGDHWHSECPARPPFPSATPPQPASAPKPSRQ